MVAKINRIVRIMRETIDRASVSEGLHHVLPVDDAMRHMEPFTTAEAAIEHVKNLNFNGAPFELPIADGLTVGGRPDQTGMGLALILDGILKHGYFPRGFEQRQGYRLYRYARGLPDKVRDSQAGGK